MEIRERVQFIAQQASEQNGCRLYDIYSHRDKYQIFIDKTDAKSVTIDDCEKVFNSLAFLLRAELPEVLKNKKLEVSSPGLEKRLREKWHFEACLGQVLKVVGSQAFTLVGKDKKETQTLAFTGCLQAVEQDAIVLSEQDKTCKISLDNIKTAQLVFLYKDNKSNKNKKRKGV